MSPAGYSGTPLARKLGIRAGHRVGAVGAPGHLSSLLAPLPADVRLTADLLRGGSPPDGSSSDESFDVLLVFARDRRELEERLGAVKPLLVPDGGLWVAWPKQSSSLATDLRKGEVRKAGLAAGLVDNKVCAVDEDWSGLRFVYRVEDRPSA
ncbi:MAG: DUF3052 family protein [Gemmatimonadetes bacterium]|nr:DUF3052 family protein [Gemmatimonadota bacterium]NIR77333.1 DUF3052 family protein [Gemmatimonadota bacterium]NIT85859.1 DUF3052 family protein [Gemmatimonadota bacterium]NIU29681.1 DUF3052 family protein [Gemmatimonadota bacterium]NIU34725.1 DUF3052 family protein [Gemmatimonadota bacterium]